LSKLIPTWLVPWNKWPKIWATSLKKNCPSKQAPNRRKIAQSGHSAFKRRQSYFWNYFIICSINRRVKEKKMILFLSDYACPLM
jgi:hypothetical protein